MILFLFVGGANRARHAHGSPDDGRSAAGAAAVQGGTPGELAG